MDQRDTPGVLVHAVGSALVYLSNHQLDHLWSIDNSITITRKHDLGLWWQHRILRPGSSCARPRQSRRLLSNVGAGWRGSRFPVTIRTAIRLAITVAIRHTGRTDTETVTVTVPVMVTMTIPVSIYGCPEYGVRRGDEERWLSGIFSRRLEEGRRRGDERRLRGRGHGGRNDGGCVGIFEHGLVGAA